MFNHVIRTLVAVVAVSATSPVDAGASGAAGVSLVSLSVGATVRQVKRTQTSGVTEYLINSDGIQRRHVMYLPESRDGGTPLPVVIDFHGSGSDPYEEMQVTGMADAAERHGFVLLMPKAAVAMPAGDGSCAAPHRRRRPHLARQPLPLLRGKIR